MINYLINSLFTSAVRVTCAGLLLALLNAPTSAQTTLLTAAPPEQSATVTAAYPVGIADPAYGGVHFISGPFTVAAGSIGVTFTAVNTAVGADSFESFHNNGSLDFPADTQLIDTASGSSAADGSTPTGPLRIDFSTGVSAFGVTVQDNAFDSETFTFTTYCGTDPVNSTTFVTPTYDNTAGPAGKSVFLGAQAIGDARITSVLISSASVAVENGGTSTANSNDFYVGPLSVYAPVPEASSLLSLGLLLIFGALLTVPHQKKEKSKR